MLLSKKTQQFKSSFTFAVAKRARELQAQGVDVINLGIGEPDFNTPAYIKQAAIMAMEKNHTKYTAIDGIPALKQSIIKKFATENNLHYELDQIMVSNGAKQCLYNAMQALLNPGEEVIIPEPYWSSYPDMVRLAGGQPIFIETGLKQNFKIIAEHLRKIISNKTKIFMINSPNNPSGIAYTKAELEKIANVLLEYPHIAILSDDIYEHLIWPEHKFYNLVMVEPELYNRTIVINGVSKSHAMTGWRLGYAAGPSNIIKAMTDIQGQSTSSICSISQYAACAALNGDNKFSINMALSFKQRHDYLVKEINLIPELSCLASNGTFYLLINVEKLITKLNLKNDSELTTLLLEKAYLAVMPGSLFGACGYIRISFAVQDELLPKIVERLRSFC